MAAGRALRVEKPALSATHGQLDVNIGSADRLEAARKRIARLREESSAKIEGTLEPSGLIIDASPDGQGRT
jgi:hypothetical protein